MPLDSLTTTQKQRAVKALQELARREIDPLRLYEPQANQDRFHKSKASERLIRGGNRSGKSTAAFVETARAARGLDPYGKFPKRELLIYIVGYDEDHIGRVIHRMLFRAGVFKIIRDLETGKWRAFRPATDVGREEETKPSPPLIPESEIDEWSWVRKSERVFAVCRLKNGTEIRAFSSKAEPAQGDPVDIVHVDEDLKYERWVGEMQARLSDTKGKLWWSAFPHSRNDALLRMSERAEEQVGRDNPDVEEFVLTFSGNPHIDADEKRKRIEGWSEEERNARDLGEFTTASVLMYPEFSMELHGIPSKGQKEDIDHLLDSLKLPGTERYAIPDNWCRYVAVDPGVAVCAVLFAAVPPDHLGNYLVLYDELYIRNCSADKLASGVASKIQNQVVEAFIIDDHGSRIRQAGSGLSVRDQYRAAFKAHGIKSVRTRHDFFPGSDDVQAGYQAVHSLLGIREDGTPKLRVLWNALPHFEKEIRNYKRKVDGELLHGGVVKDEAVKRNDHLMDTLRYIAMFGPRYTEPKAEVVHYSPAYEAWKKFKADNGNSDKSIYFAPSLAGF